MPDGIFAPDMIASHVSIGIGKVTLSLCKPPNAASEVYENMLRANGYRVTPDA
jgi:hypothetical protein